MKQNCGLRGRTPIFLSFHSTVSCRSDISLTKPSCFMRSWRISWAAGKGDRVWSVEWEGKKRKVTHAFVLCVKGESCEMQQAASKSVPLCERKLRFFVSVFLDHFLPSVSPPQWHNVTLQHKYSHLAALHSALASLSIHWTGTEARCGRASHVPIPIRDKTQWMIPLLLLISMYIQLWSDK